MRFPSIKDVAHSLRLANGSLDVAWLEEGEHGFDVRLQVYSDGSYSVHTGDPCYDQDHRGYWGSSSLPGHPRRFNSYELARDLLDQAKEHYYGC